MAPTIADVEAARERLAGVARETPLYPTETFSRLTGRSVLLKAENLQRTGSFKIRGAYNTIATLGERERAGGRRRSERRQPRPGGRVGGARGRHPGDDLHAAGRADGEGRGDAVVRRRDRCSSARASRRRSRPRVPTWRRTGATLVHAFEDERVIAGQGTIGLELAEQAPEAETVLIPIGGGGLAAGISLALKERRPDVRIVGVDVPARLHDRRRNRGQASAASSPSAILERPSTTRCRCRTTRSPRRSCSASSGRSSSWRAPAPSGSPRSSPGGSPARDPSRSCSRAGTSTRRRSSRCCGTG